MSFQSSHSSQAGRWPPLGNGACEVPAVNALCCAQWDLFQRVGILAQKQMSRDSGHCSHCLGLLFVSGASGAHPCPGGDGGQLPGGSATWLLPLIRALTSASLTGLPTPGSEGEFDMKLKIVTVLFLCWGEGLAEGRQLPLMTCPQRTKLFLCISPASAAPRPPLLTEGEPGWWSCRQRQAWVQGSKWHSPARGGMRPMGRALLGWGLHTSVTSCVMLHHRAQLMEQGMANHCVRLAVGG